MMMNFKTGCAIAAVALALPLITMSSGQAAPLSINQSVSGQVSSGNSLVTEVQWRRRGGYGYGYRRGGWGPGAGVGIGLAAGALIGGAIAAGSGPYYGPGYYGSGYYGGPAYYPLPPVAAAPVGYDDAEAYCMRRYRSYDPASGTYLNNNGNRYPCP